MLRFTAAIGVLAVCLPGVQAQNNEWLQEVTAGTRALENSDLDAARLHYTRARALVGEAPDNQLNRALVDQGIASLEQRLGHEREAESLLAGSLEIWSRQPDKNRVEYAQALASLGTLRLNQERWPEAETLLKDALGVMERLNQVQTVRGADMLSHLGAVNFLSQRYSRARELYLKAAAIQKEALPSGRTEYVYTLECLSTLALQLGQLQDGEAYAQEAYSIARDFPEKSATRADADLRLAGVYVIQRKTDRAEPLLRSALSSYEQVFGKDCAQAGVTLTMLGRIHQSEKKWALVESDFSGALERLRRRQSAQLSIGLAEVNLAQAYIDEKKFAEAAPLLRDGIEIQRRFYGRSHPNLAASLFENARLEAGLRDTEQADALFRQSIAMYEQTTNDHNPQLGTVVRAYAEFLKTNRRRQEAKAMEARAKAIFTFKN